MELALFASLGDGPTGKLSPPRPGLQLSFRWLHRPHRIHCSRISDADCGDILDIRHLHACLCTSDPGDADPPRAVDNLADHVRRPRDARLASRHGCRSLLGRVAPTLVDPCHLLEDKHLRMLSDRDDRACTPLPANANQVNMDTPGIMLRHRCVDQPGTSAVASCDHGMARLPGAANYAVRSGDWPACAASGLFGVAHPQRVPVSRIHSAAQYGRV